MEVQPKLTSAHLALFASLYALQGVVAAYFFNYNMLAMTAAGVSGQAAADVQTLALAPFIAKFLAGPVSDRFNLLGWGHRKPYIILGLAVQSLGLIGLAVVNPGENLAWYALLAFLTVTGLALYDTCCDGMVIDVTPAGDRDRVQGMLVASRAAAAMLCTLVFGLAIESSGESSGRGRVVLLACAVMGMVPLVMAARIAEPRRGDDAEAFQWRALRVLLRPRSLVLLAFGAFYALVAYGVELNLSPFYGRMLGFREGTIGAMGAARYFGRIVGASLLPVLAVRWHRGSVLVVGLCMLAGSVVMQAFVAGPAQAGVAGGLFGAANGWMDAVFFVLAMEASDQRMAASTYALFMAVTNVSVAGGSLFTRVASALGSASEPAYRPTFLLMGLFVLAAWPCLGALARRSLPAGINP